MPGCHTTFIEGLMHPSVLHIPSSLKGSSVLGSWYIQTVQTKECSLLSRLAMDSEPVKTGILRVPPVGQDPKLHYLESFVRYFQSLEHL